MTVSRQHSTRSQGAIGIQRQMGSSQLNALAIRWRLRKIIEKNFLSPALLEKKREKTISLGARDFCRQRATRCENVTQYYQAADTMIGCLLVRDCIVACTVNPAIADSSGNWIFSAIAGFSATLKVQFSCKKYKWDHLFFKKNFLY